MTLTRTQIKAARDKEIASHDWKLKAFDALLQLIPAGEESIPGEIASMLFSIVDDAPTQNRESSTSRPFTAMEGAVWSYAEHMTGEYISSDVRDALLSNPAAELPSNRDALMNGIAAGLQGLVNRGLINRKHKGRGRDPHRYETVRHPGSEEKSQ